MLIFLIDKLSHPCALSTCRFFIIRNISSSFILREVNQEAINLIPHYLMDIIHNTVTPSHLEKLQIIQNIKKLMFQVTFIFFDWIFIKQIIVFSTPFVLRETDFQNIPPGVLRGGLGHEWKCIDSMHFRGCQHHKLKILSHAWWNIQVRDLRDTTLRSLKKYERMYPWG